MSHCCAHLLSTTSEPSKNLLLDWKEGLQSSQICHRLLVYKQHSEPTKSIIYFPEQSDWYDNMPICFIIRSQG